LFANSSNTPWFEVGESTKEKNDPPRAVVLVLGWGGAQPRHVTKHAQVYQQKGCVTLVGIAPPYDVFLRPWRLDEFAKQAVRKTTALLRRVEEKPNDDSGSNNAATIAKPSHHQKNTKTPVVMHIVSNGGAFVARSIGLMLDQAKMQQEEFNKDNTKTIDRISSVTEDSATSIDDNDIDDIRLFGKRLSIGYQIFDSGPCYSSPTTSFHVMRLLAEANHYPSVVGVLGGFLYATLTVCFPRYGRDFWNDLRNDTSCLRQAVIYTSDNDPVAPSDKIEELFRERRHKHNCTIRLKDVQPSAHVEHLRRHASDYSEFIGEILTDMEKQNHKKVQESIKKS